MDKWVCTSCGYLYDPALGDPGQGLAPGTDFANVPADWRCPLCYCGRDVFDRL